MTPSVPLSTRSALRRGLLLLPLVLFACVRPGAGAVRPDGLSRTDPFANRAPTVQVQQDAEADAALAEARARAQTLEGAEAAEVYLSVRRAFPESTAGQEALYQAGVHYFESHDFARARSSFNELLYENPLFSEAERAKRLLGEAALESGAYRDAYLTLGSLADRAEGEERRTLMKKAAQAAELAGLHGAALRIAVDLAGTASGPELDSQMAEVRRQVEGRASVSDIESVQQELSASHPAWPLLTFKLARVYGHVGDYDRMQRTLDVFLRQAPDSEFAESARVMLTRMSRPERVEPRRVGVFLPLSGAYQAVGEAVLRGLRLSLEGSAVELVVKDTAGDAMQAARAVEALVLEEGAIAIIGGLLGDEARRGAVVAEGLGVPLITLSRDEHITDLGSHVFRNMMTYADQARALADYATKELGYTSFAMLYPDIPYGNELTDAFWDALDARGATVRGAESYSPDQTSYGEQVKKLVGKFYLEDRGDYRTRMREAREASQHLDAFRRRKALERAQAGVEPVVDFEALFIPEGWQKVGLIAPALAVEDVITNACDPRDLERIRRTTGNDELRTVTLLGTDQWRSPTGQSGLPALLERGGKFVTCSVYVDGFHAGSERPGTRAFVQAFQRSHRNLGREPFMLEAVGYDSGGMMRRVIEQNRPATRAAFRDALAGLRNFPGATGNTSFNARREAVKPLFYLTIENNGVRELQPTYLAKEAEGGS